MQRPSYEAYWRTNRRHRLIFAVAMLGWGPYILVVRELTGSLHWVVLLPWALFWLWANYRFLRAGPMLCPRCNDVFRMRGYVQIRWPARCYHCGLRRGAPTDPTWKAPELGAPPRKKSRED